MSTPYLELLKRVLTDTVLVDEPPRGEPDFAERFARHYFDNRRALTCVPRARLDHLEQCVRTVVADRVFGDLCETGVWRGGVTIFMRALLRELGVTDRAVWAADSFTGLPQPDPVRFPREALAFASPAMARLDYLAVARAEVEAAFARFGLLDEQVRLLAGWFADTLPGAPIERLAVLRLDGDFYQSTRDALDHLYDRVADGGYVIVDDYGEDDWTYCRQAVDEFRSERGLDEPLERVDPYCVAWRRTAR